MKKNRAIGIAALLVLGVVCVPLSGAQAIPTSGLGLASEASAEAVSQTDEEAAAVWAEMSKKPFVWESQPIGTALQEVNAAFPDVASYISVDSDREVFQVSYSDRAEAARIDEYLAAIRAVPSKYPVEITVNSYTLADQNALAAKIAADPEKYREVLGGFPDTIVPEKDGSIAIKIQESSAGDRWIDIDGMTVHTMPDGGEGGAQSRTNDTSPWTAGSRIQNSTGYCAQGFRWQRWVTNEIGFGTSKHCGGGVFSSNLGVTIGSRLYSSSDALDQQFVRVTNGSVASTVWATSTAEYQVGGAQVLLPGAVIASSLISKSAPTVTTVAGSNVYASALGYSFLFGPMDYAWSTTCSPGDSGGPWITTTGGANPQAIAHGQHWGNEDFYSGNNLYYCGYFNITSVSASLGATLKL